MNSSALNFIKNKLCDRLRDKLLDYLLLGFLEKGLVNKIINDENLREIIVDTLRDLESISSNNNICRQFYP